MRDRLDLEWGGALAGIELPASGAPGLAGPLLLRGAARFLRSPLPLRKEKRVEPERSTRVVRGSIPLLARPIAAGETLEFLTVACPGGGSEAIETLRRFVSREGQPLFRLEARLRPAGDCVTVRDELDTTPMAAGDYVYHVQWPEPSPLAPEAQLSFRIAGPDDRERGPSAAGESPEP